MVGDGVNDVLALKQARLAIAMGNGSQMAKGVADLVLLTNAFATVPRAIEEGRRILRNTQRVAKLFVTKSVYAALLLATLGLAPLAYPFLPRHLTIISTLTVGLPAFFLALAASEGPVRREGFPRELASFALPFGAVAAATIAAGYLLARGPLDRSLVEARTISVGIAIAIGLSSWSRWNDGLRPAACVPGCGRSWPATPRSPSSALPCPGCASSSSWQPDAADWLVIAVVGGCGLVLLALVRRAVAVFGKAADEGSGQR